MYLKHFSNPEVASLVVGGFGILDNQEQDMRVALVGSQRVLVPKTHHIVTSGECQIGDKFLDVSVFPGVIQWRRVEWDEFGMPAYSFDCLIRRSELIHEGAD